MPIHLFKKTNPSICRSVYLCQNVRLSTFKRLLEIYTLNDANNYYQLILLLTEIFNFCRNNKIFSTTNKIVQNSKLKFVCNYAIDNFPMHEHAINMKKLHEVIRQKIIATGPNIF